MTYPPVSILQKTWINWQNPLVAIVLFQQAYIAIIVLKHYPV
jgi:hypothetical protein